NLRATSSSKGITESSLRTFSKKSSAWKSGRPSVYRSTALRLGGLCAAFSGPWSGRRPFPECGYEYLLHAASSAEPQCEQPVGDCGGFGAIAGMAHQDGGHPFGQFPCPG